MGKRKIRITQRMVTMNKLVAAPDAAAMRHVVKYAEEMVQKYTIEQKPNKLAYWKQALERKRKKLKELS